MACFSWKKKKKRVGRPSFFFFFFVLKSSLKNNNKVLLNQGFVWLLRPKVACGAQAWLLLGIIVQVGRVTCCGLYFRPRSSQVSLTEICQSQPCLGSCSGQETQVEGV